MVITYSRVWINRVRLPILLVFSWTGKINIYLSPFAPQNLVSRDGLGRPVPRQPAHSPYSDRTPCFPTEFLPIYGAASIRLFKPPYVIGPVPNLSGHVIVYRWRSLPRVRRYRASSPQGSSSNGCCLCITMDQLMCASLFAHPLKVWSGHVGSIGEMCDLESFKRRAISKNDWTKSRGFNESKNTKTKYKKRKRKKRNARERQDSVGKQNVRRIQVHTIYGLSTMANEPARARLLFAILSSVLPVTLGHSTAYRSPALTFSAAIHIAMKRSAPCSAVSRHSFPPWAAIIHWSAFIPKALRSFRRHPIHFPPSRSPRPSSVLLKPVVILTSSNEL